MLEYFLKPLKYIFIVIIIGGLGVLADIATLVNINVVHIFKSYSPTSYYLAFSCLFNIYLVLVIREIITNFKQDGKGVRNNNKNNDSKMRLEEKVQVGSLKNLSNGTHKVHFKNPFDREPNLEIAPFESEHFEYKIIDKTGYGFEIKIVNNLTANISKNGFKWVAEGQINSEQH